MHSKPTTICLKIFNYLPMALGFLGGFIPALITASCITAVAFISLGMDYWKCTVRWGAGKMAEWPKFPGMTFFVVDGVFLILLCEEMMSDKEFKHWSGVITVSCLFLMSVSSNLFGKPFTWAEAIEYLEHMKDEEHAKKILNDQRARHNYWTLNVKLTNMWSIAFLVMVLVELAGVYLSPINHTAALACFVGGPFVVSWVTFKRLTPKVAEKHYAEIRAAKDAEAPLLSA